MKKKDYDQALGLINKKLEIEEYKAWFDTTSPRTPHMSISWHVINMQMNGQGKQGNPPHWDYNNILRRINQELPDLFKALEVERSQLERDLANITREVASKRAEVQQLTAVEAELTEAISRSAELDAQITASRAELETATQTKETLLSDKMALISSMSDDQKFFILTKAQEDSNAEIIDLLHSTGFDENAYQEQRAEAMGDTDEIPDVFA